MKTKKLLSVHPSSVHVQLGLCAAALAGAAVGVPQAARADVVTFNGPFDVPQTFSGIYIDLATGLVTGTPTGNPGWDFNPYSNGGSFAIYWEGTPGIAAGVLTGPGSMMYADLGPGAVVGPGSDFSNLLQVPNATDNFIPAGNHILGFRFFNEGTNAVDYGYVTITSSGPANGGFPITVQSWSFENNGGSITVVPEPATVALLTLSALALGAVGMRRWRKAA
jgi:hypothetical protein